MNVITVSREYGAGGGEVARRLAEALGWELLDRELLHQAAALEHVPDTELERLDENVGAAAIELTSEDLHEIDSAASMITVQGARYPEQLQRMVGR